MNVLQSGLSYLNTELKSYASTLATMERDGVLISNLSVTLGSQFLRVTDRQGNTKVERTDLDILVDAADLVLSGVQTEPRAGDNWFIDRGQGLEQFEVMAFNNEAPWRYCDPFKTRLRIHTKFIGFGTPAIGDSLYAGDDVGFAGGEDGYAGAGADATSTVDSVYAGDEVGFAGGEDGYGGAT